LSKSTGKPADIPMMSIARVPAYYLGRPAGLWLAALARRPATHKSSTCAAAGHASSAAAS